MASSDNFGLQFQHGGDAVPGGYNGYVAAFHSQTGEKMGYLDYQTTSATGRYASYHRPGFKIGMVEVDPRFRGHRVASELLMETRRQIPEGKVDPGYLTPEGHEWWKSAGRTIAKRYRP